MSEQTVNPDQLPEIAAIPPDLHTIVFSPGGPLQKLPYDMLLAKLISAETVKVDEDALQADLAHDEHKVALVHNDPDPLKNGWWRKTGASGAGNWVQFEQLAMSVSAAITVARNEAREALDDIRSTVTGYLLGEIGPGAALGQLIPRYSTLTDPAITVGKVFARDPRAGVLAPMWEQTAQGSQFRGWIGLTAEGEALKGRMVSARARPDRPACEWDYAFGHDGSYAPNTGRYGDASPDPLPTQELGAGNIMFDGDGGSTPVRTLFPANLVNSLGYAECVHEAFAADGHAHSLYYHFDFQSTTPRNSTFVIGARRAPGQPAKAMFLGSSSSAQGPRTAFVPGDAVAEIAVNTPNYGGAATWSIGVQPAAGSAPAELVYEYTVRKPMGSVTPTLSRLREFYRACHAQTPIATGNALFRDDGAFVPTFAASNLIATLRGEIVSDFRISAYMDVPEEESGVHGPGEPYSASGAYAIAAGYEGRVPPDNVNNASYASILAHGNKATNIEYFGHPGVNIGASTNFSVAQVPAVYLPKSGPTRIDGIIYGDSAGAPQLSNFASPTQQIGFVFVNGVPVTGIPVARVPTDFNPRVMYLAGARLSTPSPVVSRSSNTQNMVGPSWLPRFDPNQTFPPGDYNRAIYDRVLAEVIDDIRKGRVPGLQMDTAVPVEGTSLARFSGNAFTWLAKMLASPGFLVHNMSQGGARWHIGPDVLAVGSTAFQHPARIAIRRAALRAIKAISAELGTPAKIMPLLDSVENAPTHLDDPVQALIDLETLWPAEMVAEGILDSSAMIASVPPTGEFGLAGRASKDGFNAYLRSEFSIATDCQYLFRRPNWVPGKYEFMIDIAALSPVRHLDPGGNPANAVSYVDHDAKLLQTGPGWPNYITAGDFQHSGGTDGHKFYANDCYAPAIVEAFQLKHARIIPCQYYA